MIWEGVSTHSSVKHASVVRVLPSRTEVEDPEVLSVSVFEELLRVFSAIAIQTLHADCRVSHDDYLVGNIDQVFGKFEQL